jgi:hypothetical protein
MMNLLGIPPRCVAFKQDTTRLRRSQRNRASGRDPQGKPGGICGMIASHRQAGKLPPAAGPQPRMRMLEALACGHVLVAIRPGPIVGPQALRMPLVLRPQPERISPTRGSPARSSHLWHHLPGPVELESAHREKRGGPAH